jgi:hypothetical protein
MTDARMPGSWLYDPVLDALSDRAWRTFVGSLMWSAEQGTEGDLPARSLRLLHPDGIADVIADELVTAKRWGRTSTGFKVLDWTKTQSRAADVERQRSRNRRNTQAFRDRQRGIEHDGSRVSDDVITDVSADVRDDALGQARQGKDSVTEPTNNRKTALDFAREFDCIDCQRSSAFTNEPCPSHRESA